MACPANTVLASAAANGYFSPDAAALQIAIAQLTCDLKAAIQAGGGGGGGLPSGAIIMWKGTIATIPAGFVLCNGANGTPDLRDKFVCCASADNAGVAKTGYPDGTLRQSDNGIFQLGVLDSGGTATHNIIDIQPFDTVGVPYFALAYIMKT